MKNQLDKLEKAMLIWIMAIVVLLYVAKFFLN